MSVKDSELSINPTIDDLAFILQIRDAAMKAGQFAPALRAAELLMRFQSERLNPCDACPRVRTITHLHSDSWPITDASTVHVERWTDEQYLSDPHCAGGMFIPPRPVRGTQTLIDHIHPEP